MGNSFRRATQVTALFLVTWAAASLCAAQTARLRVQRPPYYINQPVTLQLVVSGFEEQPQPAVELQEDPAAPLTLSLIGVSPQVSQSIMNINGRITRSRNVVFQYSYNLTVSKAGSFTIGPFTVRQGGREATSGQATLDIEEIPLIENMDVEFDIPDRAVFLGERVPVAIRWSYVGDLQKLDNLTIRAPALSQFEIEPTPVGNQQTSLVVLTAREQLKFPATMARRRIDNEEHIQLVAEAEMLVDQVGEFEFEPISASVREVTRWSRDPYGDLFEGFGLMGPRRASESRIVRAVGKRQKLTVQPLPEEGRPASFAGAVGERYAIDVEANRSVVRVGDPINLTVTLIGDRSLKTAQLPDLSADGGMSPAQFRLPAESPSGVFRDGRKQFDVTVRVMEESVREIPPLTYSWFDPTTERYSTSHSDPIALRVLPAEVISAEDVVSAMVRNGTEQPSADNAEETDIARQAASRGDLAGLDLSIEEDLDKLSTGRPPPRFWITALPYALGLIALAWAVVDRRRMMALASGGELRRQLYAQVRKITDAAKLPRREAAIAIAEALRAMLPHATRLQRETLDRLIAQLEAMIFAPSGTSDTALDQQLRSEAERAAREVTASATKQRESA